LVGLTCSALFAWPFPDAPSVAVAAGWRSRLALPPRLPAGLYPWPVWYPLPHWLPAGSWQLGLLTGLAGAAAGMLAMRVLRFTFGLTRGIEALGVGDADLMMMAGSFVGWQPVVLSCLVAAFPGLLFGMIQLLRRGNQALPFGPSLALGVLLTLWLWPLLSNFEAIRLVFFVPIILAAIAGAGAMFLLVAGFVCRFLFGTPNPGP
jgi:leader peptidase (prepilin peptidase)/N-methyltransferase